MKNKIPWQFADDSWRGKLRSYFARIKMLFCWRQWRPGRKRVPAARPMQEALTVMGGKPGYGKTTLSGAHGVTRLTNRGKYHRRGQN